MVAPKPIGYTATTTTTPTTTCFGWLISDDVQWWMKFSSLSCRKKWWWWHEKKWKVIEVNRVLIIIIYCYWWLWWSSVALLSSMRIGKQSKQQEAKTKKRERKKVKVQQYRFSCKPVSHTAERRHIRFLSPLSDSSVLPTNLPTSYLLFVFSLTSKPSSLKALFIEIVLNLSCYLFSVDWLLG